jgi:apolipoprotein N-acyltransferase
VWWILLIRRQELPGRRPYLALWTAGFLFWLAAIHWLRLPHWLTAIGWVGLSAWLACYWPVFFCLSRIAVHRLRVPVIIAAPVVWTGLQLAQAHLLTGFRMGALAHTQYRWITLIQIADLAGDYAVDFLIIFVAACLARMVRCDAQRRIVLWPLLPAAAILAATLGYGYFRTAGQYTRPAARVALIQGSIDTELKEDPKQDVFIHRQYLDLSYEALAGRGKVDLVVWPETMFRKPYFTVDPQAQAPLDWPDSAEDFQKFRREAPLWSLEQIERTVRAIGVPTILGVDGTRIGVDRVYRYNTALLLSADGKPVARYDKMHPVLFGEYMPFVHAIPWLQRMTPVSVNLDSGEHPTAFAVGGVRFSPSICYETVLAHVIRGQVAELRRSGQEPQVLVNLTNDGWFWGSSELDMHLICGVFRAIECRKPLVIAANTGFSASIDGDGRILAQGPRRATGALVADVRADLRSSPYLVYGDLPAGICLGFCAVLAVVAVVGRYRRSAPLRTPTESRSGQVG